MIYIITENGKYATDNYWIEKTSNKSHIPGFGNIDNQLVFKLVILANNERISIKEQVVDVDFTKSKNMDHRLSAVEKSFNDLLQKMINRDLYSDAKILDLRKEKEED